MTSFLYQPPRPDRKIKSMVGRSTNRKSDESLEHLTRGGLPVNPQVLKMIRDNLARGEYHSNPNKLIDDVKSDPGTFLHVARNMKAFSEESRDGVDPLDQLRSLEDEKLKKLFSISEREISIHRLRDATPAQVLRFQHSVISARTAEALAPEAHISPDIAFAGAALRQLGHSMLAWNYPAIYSRALLRQRQKGVSLEVELKNLVGLSPAEVGTRMTSLWNLKSDLRRALSVSQAAQTQADADFAATSAAPVGKLSIEKVFELSELFAKANDPQHYPKALEQWETSARAIEQSSGLDVAALVRPSVERSFESLELATSHSVRTQFFEKVPPPAALSPAQTEMLTRNPYLGRCQANTRLNLEGVYQLFAAQGVSVEALRVLVDEMIPLLGFTRGCLYLLKKDQNILKPALRVGDVPLETYRTVREGENSPISGSLGTQVQLSQQVRLTDGRDTLLFVGSVLNDIHPGVLQLEADPEKLEDFHSDLSLHFNVIRFAIGQCLGQQPLA